MSYSFLERYLKFFMNKGLYVYKKLCFVNLLNKYQIKTEHYLSVKDFNRLDLSIVFKKTTGTYNTAMASINTDKHIPAASKEYYYAIIPATVGAKSSPPKILMLNLFIYNFCYNAEAIFAH